jgi:hypothetical protein
MGALRGGGQEFKGLWGRGARYVTPGLCVNWVNTRCHCPGNIVVICS